MAESRVKVGVRIRPLLPKEKGQNATFTSYDKQSVNFKGNTYTFDHVFGMELSQSQLYAETAAPMLRSFMEGYNCTIMAYGQTGSGKTFTMGTSDMIYHDTSNQGLISRFVTDLYANLTSSIAEGRHISFQIKACYLEIYGEEVYDLLDASASTSNRISLAVREDESGRIFVQGQREVTVGSAESTLEVLSSGARHRITASTAMNAGSSRSHAVFTLLLEQKIRGASSIDNNNSDSDSDPEEIQLLSSKLTFVDLAGSERIKRTGAEGQRLKEGIQINSGLFNLGQVINALADEQKLKSGNNRSNHIPYRNSKLTHLLKDALGGNSQTLFLACVSPAESNENETLSTLMYAKQARNIQNKPIQNVDKIQKELQRLRYAVKVWTMKAVRSMFTNKSSSSAKEKEGGDSGQNDNDNDDDCDLDAFMQRPEVSEFISSVNASIDDSISRPVLDVITPMSGVCKMITRLSVGNPLAASPSYSKRSLMYSPLREREHRHRNQPPSHHYLHHHHQSNGTAVASSSSMYSPASAFPGVSGAYLHGPGGHDSILAAFPAISNAIANPSSEATFEESEKLIARMIDMVQQEKVRYLAGEKGNKDTLMMDPSSTSTNDAAAADDGDDAMDSIQHDLVSSNTSGIIISDAMMMMEGTSIVPSAVSADIIQMDSVIQEKEEILSKLLDTVKGYSVMKMEFEKLLDAINSLEDEKKELESELERVKKLPGGNTTSNTAAAERVRDRFLKVKEELRVMRDERKNKENAFRLMQRESKQCELLQKEIKKLKEGRVALAKQHKSQVQEMIKLKKDQAVKAMSFKKNDVKKQQMMNTLKAELTKKERILALKDKEITRINMKLRACEEHITQLLKIQNRNRAKVGGGIGNATLNNSSTGRSLVHQLTTADAEHLSSSKAMLEHMLIDRLELHINKIMYQQKSVQLAELNRDMEHDATQLEALLSEKKRVVSELRSRGIIATRLLDKGMESGEDIEMMVDGDDVDNDEMVELTSLCGAQNNGLSEEEKYRISELNTNINMCENALERLTKEVDECNADIDELSLRLEEHTTTTKGSHNMMMTSTTTTTNGKSKSNGISQDETAWEVMGKEIVAGLSLSQSHVLLWDLMDEKIKTLEQLRIANNSLSRCMTEQDFEAEKTLELQNWVTSLRDELKTRLERAEKQRVHDVWALMQASNGSSGSVSHHLHAGGTSDVSVQVEGTAARIAILRAHELEKELQSRVIKEESMRTEIDDKADLIHNLQTRLSAAVLKADFRDCDSITSVVEGLMNNSASLDGSSSTINSSGGDDGGGDVHLTQLFKIWEELGLPDEERREALSYIQKARVLAKERAVMDAEYQLQSMVKEADVVKAQLHLLCSAMGCEVSDYLHDENYQRFVSSDMMSTIYNPLLIPMLEALKFSSQQVVVDICSKLPSFCTLKDKLTDIMSEMWLEISDLPLALRPLAKLTIDMPSINAASQMDDKTQLFEQVMTLSQQLSDYKVSMRSSVVVWESELRKLNLIRVQLTSKLISVRDSCMVLIDELKFVDVRKQLFALVQSFATANFSSIDQLSLSSSTTSNDQDQLSVQAINAAVQLLNVNSASNPPGSEKLLSALERTKLVLESVKATRTTVGLHVSNLLHHFITHFTVDPATASLPTYLNLLTRINEGQQSKVFSTSHVEELFDGLDFITSYSREINHDLHTKLRDALMEVNVGSSESIVCTQISDYLKHKLQLTAVGGGGGANDNNLVISSFIVSMEEVVEELEAMSIFIEEEWVQLQVHRLVSQWHSKCSEDTSSSSSSSSSHPLRDVVRENDVLLEESRRMEGIAEAHRDLLRADQLLIRHIQEMDDFEAQSKLDRVKALSGNSKLLIEEEKFRKNGKKKYEQLADKMSLLFAKLSTLATTGNGNGTTPSNQQASNGCNMNLGVDVRTILMGLSVKGKALLKGRFRERIELMHLALNSTYSGNGVPVVSSKVSYPPSGMMMMVGDNNSNSNAKENHALLANGCEDVHLVKESNERTSSSSTGSVKSMKSVSSSASMQYANPFLMDGHGH